MSKPQSFKEFINTSTDIDDETYKTLIALVESHPAIQYDATVQRLLNDKNARVSVSELSSVLRSILKRCVSLAKSAPSASDSDRLLIAIEQNVLTVSAAALSAAISARMQTSIDKLSTIVRVTKR